MKGSLDYGLELAPHSHTHNGDPGSLLCDITEVLDLGLQTPVPFVLHQERVLVEVSIS